MTRDAGNASRAQSGRPSRYSSQEEVVVTYTDGTQVVLARDASTGQFKCARCSFCSANSRTLSSHGQRGCAESSHGGQQQDVDEQELARLDMIWDAEYSVLVCQVCEEGVDLAKLDNHWRHEVHDYLDKDESRECANQVRQALGTSVNLTSTTFTKPAPGARPIKSLPTYQGYVCPAPGCGWCSTHKFVRHMRKQHRSQADKKRYTVLQRWNAASGWFSVAPAVLRLHEHRSRRPSKRARPSPSPSQAPSSQADSASEYAQSDADSSFSADVDVASASTRARRAASDAASSRAPSVASGVVASRAASVQVESSDEEAGPAVVIELLSSSNSSDGSTSAKSASAPRSSHSADVMPAPRTAASQRAAPLASSAQAPPPAPSPNEQRPPASASSYQPSSATQQTSSRQQPSSSASKPSATPLNSASQRRAPLPTLRSFFGADADKWKSAARAPKVSRDGATLNVCTWRHAEATIDEEADVCEKSFTTGEALARHVMAKHVRHAEKLRGKIMCRWGTCMNRAYEPGAMDEHMLRHLAQVAFCCPFKQCRLNAQASPTDLAAQDRHIDSYHGKASAAELRPLLLQPLEPLSALADLARFQHVAANAVTLEQLPHEKLSFERQGYTVALKKLSNRSVIAQRRAATVSTSSHLRTPASLQAVLAASQGGGEESVDAEEIRPAWSVTIEALNARETQLERAAAREAHLCRIPTGVSRRLIFDVDEAGYPAASGSRAANGAAFARSSAQAPARKSEQPRKPTKERARATSDKSSSSPRGKRTVYDALPSDSDSEAEVLRKTLEELRRSHKKGSGAKYQALLEDWKRRKASQATLPRAQASNGVARGVSHREQKNEAAPPSSGRMLAAFVDLPLPSSSQRTSSAQPARAEPKPESKLLAASLMDPRRWLRVAQTQSPAPSVVGKEGALQAAANHGSASNGQASAEPRSPLPRSAKEKEIKAGPSASLSQQRRKTEPSSSVTDNNSLSRVLPETQHDNIHGRTFGGRFAPKKAVQAMLQRVSDDDEEYGQSSSRQPNGHASSSQSSRSKPRSRKRRHEASDADESDEADRPVFSQASRTKKRARESTSLTPRKRKKRIVCSSDEEE